MFTAWTTVGYGLWEVGYFSIAVRSMIGDQYKENFRNWIWRVLKSLLIIKNLITFLWYISFNIMVPDTIVNCSFWQILIFYSVCRLRLTLCFLRRNVVSSYFNVDIWLWFTSFNKASPCNWLIKKIDQPHLIINLSWTQPNYGVKMFFLNAKAFYQISEKSW